MGISKHTDEQLMLAFAQGEVSAFDELFLRYWEKLRAFCARVFGMQPAGGEAGRKLRTACELEGS